MSVEISDNYFGTTSKGVTSKDNVPLLTSGNGVDKKPVKTTQLTSAKTSENELQSLELEEDSAVQEQNDPASIAAQRIAQREIEKAQQEGLDVQISVKGNEITKAYPNGRTAVITIGENGRMTQQVVVEGEGENISKSVFEYDSEGLKIGQTTTKGVGENQTVAVYQFDEGKKIGKTVTGMKEGKECLVEYSYDKDEKITEKVITTGTGDDAEVKTVDYFYDEKGDLVEKFTEYPDGRMRAVTYSDIVHNEDGSITRTAEISIEDAEGNVTKTFSAAQTVNNEGQVVSAARFDDSGKKVRDLKKEFNDDGSISKKEFLYYNADGTKTSVVYSDFKSFGDLQTCKVEIVTVDETGKVIAKETQKRTRFFDGTQKFDITDKQGDYNFVHDDSDD